MSTQANRIVSGFIFLIMALYYCWAQGKFTKRYELCNHETGNSKVPALQADVLIWLPVGQPVTSRIAMNGWDNLGDGIWIESKYVCEVK